VAVTVLLAVLVAVDLFSLGAGWRILALLGAPEGDVSDREWDVAVTLYGVSGALQGVGPLAVAVCFLVWFFRVRRNSEVFVPDGHRWTSAWAICSWFIPLVNFWLPCRVALDTWRASAPLDPVSLRPVRVSVAPVHLWWWAWLFGTLVGALAGSEYGEVVEADRLHWAVVEMSVADALDILAAVLAILFVRKLTGMQDARAGGSGRPGSSSSPGGSGSPIPVVPGV
jgi:hypothetical protein